MKTSTHITNSSDFIGKKVNLVIEDQDVFTCTIDVLEQDGIIVHYYTEDEDSTSFCDVDDEGAVLTFSYYPWSKISEIQYRQDEKY